MNISAVTEENFNRAQKYVLMRATRARFRAPDFSREFTRKCISQPAFSRSLDAISHIFHLSSRAAQEHAFLRASFNERVCAFARKGTAFPRETSPGCKQFMIHMTYYVKCLSLRKYKPRSSTTVVECVTGEMQQLPKCVPS